MEKQNGMSIEAFGWKKDEFINSVLQSAEASFFINYCWYSKKTTSIFLDGFFLQSKINVKLLLNSLVGNL